MPGTPIKTFRLRIFLFRAAEDPLTPEDIAAADKFLNSRASRWALRAGGGAGRGGAGRGGAGRGGAGGGAGKARGKPLLLRVAQGCAAPQPRQQQSLLGGAAPKPPPARRAAAPPAAAPTRP